MSPPGGNPQSDGLRVPCKHEFIDNKRPGDGKRTYNEFYMDLQGREQLKWSLLRKLNARNESDPETQIYFLSFFVRVEGTVVFLGHLVLVHFIKTVVTNCQYSGLPGGDPLPPSTHTHKLTHVDSITLCCCNLTIFPKSLRKRSKKFLQTLVLPEVIFRSSTPCS